MRNSLVCLHLSVWSYGYSLRPEAKNNKTSDIKTTNQNTVSKWHPQSRNGTQKYNPNEGSARSILITSQNKPKAVRIIATMAMCSCTCTLDVPRCMMGMVPELPSPQLFSIRSVLISCWIDLQGIPPSSPHPPSC